MPDIKVCFWNIQNYGSDAKWGASDQLRNQIIRDFVRDKAIDVLLIMEVQQAARNALADLVTVLNAGLGTAAQRDWATAFCGSALRSRSADPPANEGDLTFRTDGRSEGYGVAWRTNRAKFDMVPGLTDITEAYRYLASNLNPPTTGVLNLTTKGRPADNVTEDVPGGSGRKKRKRTVFRPLGGYRTTGLFPYRNGTAMTSWPQLEMPTTGRAAATAIRWAKARRPAYIVLDLIDSAGHHQLCPVLVYHAPSNLGRADYGAMLAGLSRELYVTNPLGGGGAPDPANLVHTAKAAIGGDFNYSVDTANWPDSYFTSWQSFGAAWNRGANGEDIPDHAWADADRRTTVQLLQGDHMTPITSGNLADYYFHKIDLAFYRGDGAERSAPVHTMMANPNPYAATLQAYRTSLNAAVAALPTTAAYHVLGTGPGPQRNMGTALAPDWKSYVHGSWGSEIQHWNNLLTDLNNGYFSSARRAAEFFHIFVSDHLPLTVTFTVA